MSFWSSVGSVFGNFIADEALDALTGSDSSSKRGSSSQQSANTGSASTKAYQQASLAQGRTAAGIRAGEKPNPFRAQNEMANFVKGNVKEDNIRKNLVAQMIRQGADPSTINNVLRQWDTQDKALSAPRVAASQSGFAQKTIGAQRQSMAQKTEFLDIDLLNMKPVPGESLVEEPGKRPYERPPQITEVDKALKYLLSSTLDDDEIREELFDVLDMGMSVETVVSAMLMQNFSEGIFTPDVAELVKVPMIQLLTQAASDSGIEDLNITNENLPKKRSTEDRVELMRTLNPQKFDRLREEGMAMNEEMPMEEEELEMEAPMEQGFINKDQESMREVQNGYKSR